MHPYRRTKQATAGVTLLEVIFVTVILAALAKFAMMKLVTPATMTLQTQAQSVADLIRRAQSLAVVRGQRMSVSVAASAPNWRVAVACASAPCNTDTDLLVTQGVSMVANTLYFNSLGQPVNSSGTALPADASFPLSYTTGSNVATHTVRVRAVTGRVCVSPSVPASECP
jgi:Tfp pilus assembly protein FimT